MRTSKTLATVLISAIFAIPAFAYWSYSTYSDGWDPAWQPTYDGYASVWWDESGHVINGAAFLEWDEGTSGFLATASVDNSTILYEMVYSSGAYAELTNVSDSYYGSGHVQVEHVAYGPASYAHFDRI